MASEAMSADLEIPLEVRALHVAICDLVGHHFIQGMCVGCHVAAPAPVTGKEEQNHE